MSNPSNPDVHFETIAGDPSWDTLRRAIAVQPNQQIRITISGSWTGGLDGVRSQVFKFQWGVTGLPGKSSPETSPPTLRRWNDDW
jgi:hypothetical protein